MRHRRLNTLSAGTLALAVVSRSNETQLQVGENVSKIENLV